MSDCLSNFDWSFVQSFVICSFSGGQRTKVLISYLHQRGGGGSMLGLSFLGEHFRRARGKKVWGELKIFLYAK